MSATSNEHIMPASVSVTARDCPINPSFLAQRTPAWTQAVEQCSSNCHAQTRNPVCIFKQLLDYSLRSPSGPPAGRARRYAFLSGIRRNDES
jgi:hypothetical protein